MNVFLVYIVSNLYSPNAVASIVSTLAGISIEVNALQDMKAP